MARPDPAPSLEPLGQRHQNPSQSSAARNPSTRSSTVRSNHRHMTAAPPFARGAPSCAAAPGHPSAWYSSSRSPRRTSGRPPSCHVRPGRRAARPSSGPCALARSRLLCLEPGHRVPDSPQMPQRVGLLTCPSGGHVLAQWLRQSSPARRTGQPDVGHLSAAAARARVWPLHRWTTTPMPSSRSWRS